MISPEVKSFDSFVARMGEGKGQILTIAWHALTDNLFMNIVGIYIPDLSA
jgi:hypothetical protein